MGILHLFNDKPYRLMQKRHWLAKPHRVLQLRLAIVMLLSGLALLAADFVGLRSARQEALQAAWADSANLATSFAARTQGLIEAADAVLLSVHDQIETEGTTPLSLARLGRMIAAARHALPAIQNVVVLDEAGRILIQSGDDARSGVEEAASFFAAHTGEFGDTPFLGWPAEDGAGAPAALPLALRLVNARGATQGTVVALVPLLALQSMFDGFDVGRHGAIALIRADGTLLARVPGEAAALGKPVESLPVSGPHRDRVVLTEGGAQLLTDVWVKGAPLVIRIDRSKRDILAGWLMMAAFHAAGLGLIIGLLLILAWRLSANIGEREQSHSDLAMTHAQLKAMEEQTARDNRFLAMAEEVARVGHWRLTLSGSAGLSWSDEVFRLHGVEKASFQPSPDHVVDAFHPDDRERVRDAVRRTVQTGQPFELVARIVRPDGSIRQVRSRGFFQPETPDTPPSVFGVIMDVTEQMEAEAALKAAKAQADAANAQLEAANHALQALVLQDPLTGLSNRRHFDRALGQEFRRALRNGTPIGLVLLDVDHFKQFNDLYGHQSGDACLKAIAGTIPKLLNRPGDIAARYGGEEIVLLLPGTSMPGARAIAERVAQAVRALDIAHRGNPHGQVTVSAGVEAFVPARDLDTDAALVAHADVALYAAKRAGRDRIVCFGEVPAAA